MHFKGDTSRAENPDSFKFLHKLPLANSHGRNRRRSDSKRATSALTLLTTPRLRRTFRRLFVFPGELLTPQCLCGSLADPRTSPPCGKEIKECARGREQSSPGSPFSGGPLLLVSPNNWKSLQRQGTERGREGGSL